MDGPVAENLLPAASEKPQRVRLFSLSQRVGRVRFVSYSMIGASLCALLLLLTYFICLTLPPPLARLLYELASICLMQILLPVIVVIMTIRRLHDINAAGWWSLLIVIPFANMVLLFIPGSVGENRFGPPPPENSALDKFIAIGLPLATLSLFIALKNAPPGNRADRLEPSGPHGLRTYPDARD